MNEIKTSDTEQNVIKQFLKQHPELQKKKSKIAKALDLSRWQFRRLEIGECKIMAHIKQDLWRLDHFLANEGKIEDFHLPEYGEESKD